MDCPFCGTVNDPSAERCAVCGRDLTALAPGRVIDRRYEILRSLGEGGMGTVFKVQDRTLDEIVALKVLRPLGADPQDLTARFRSEIKLARKVSHRNVCRIYEYGEAEGLSYVVMEYIDGPTLRQAVRGRGGLDEPQAYDVALQICRGLQAVHDVGIIHRDLKTANIMWDSRQVIRLMDFGIAQLWREERPRPGARPESIVGTPEYMSPEQARGQKLDFQSDIYSLGIVLYELYTGELPFGGEGPMDVIVKHILEPPPQNPHIPSYVAVVLRKALAKDPGVRYATARGVAADMRLGRSSGGAPVRIAVAPETETAAGAGMARPITPTGQGTPTPLRRVRGSIDAAVRARIEDLVSLLSDPDERVRWRTAVNLCLIGPPAKAALPALNRARSDSSRPVADAAAEAVKRIVGEVSVDTTVEPPEGPLPQPRPPIVDRFIRDLKQADAFVRWSAAVALGELGSSGAAAVPRLVEALDDLDDNVRWAAAISLGKMGESAVGAVRALVAALNDPTDEVLRRHAAAALGCLGASARAAVPGLIAAFRAQDVGVRAQAAAALVTIGPPAVPALLEALNDDDGGVRFEAADALTKIGVGYRPS